MEKKRGILSHIGTLVRIVLLIIFVAIITFFMVRFFRNRQATQRAEQTVSQNDQSKESASESEKSKEQTQDQHEHSDDSNKADDSRGESNDNAGENIPSGIADGDDSKDSVPTTGPSQVPAAGMGTNVLIIAIILSFATYAATRKIQLEK